MSMMAMGMGAIAPGAASPALRQILADLAATEAPPPQAAAVRPTGPGGTVLFDALRSASPPMPEPRYQSASPAAGGIGAAPAQMEGFGSFNGPIQPRPASGAQVAPPPMAQPKLSKSRFFAGILADALAGFNGRPGMMAQTWQREREIEGQRATEEARWHRDRSAKREDAVQPRMEQVGDALGQYDPGTQTFTPIYTKPQAFERYAQALGYKAGTPEYAQAVEDYRLGGWSDPAMENRTALEDVRYEHRDDLQDQRLTVQSDVADRRIRAQRDIATIRAARRAAPKGPAARAPTKSTVLGGIIAKQARGEKLTPGEEGVMSQHGGVKYPDGTVIEMPNGETKVVRNGRLVSE